MANNVPAYEAFTPQSEGETPQEKGTCCGREVTRCGCMSTKTFYTIITVVGSILLAFGALSLIGYFSPAPTCTCTSALSKAIYFIATKLGSDPFALAIFSASFGAAFTATGAVGLILERCQQTPKPAANSEPFYE